MTEASNAYHCHEFECETVTGRPVGFIDENENAPGLRTQISWPGELTEAKVGTIRLHQTNVALYVHCQFDYTAPTERPGSGAFTGLEERDSAEYNGGTKPTCTTGHGG